jgi:O-antigen/teichoic acid export membrane protein
VSVFLILTIILYADEIVAAWVGSGYRVSSTLLAWQAGPYFFAFLAYPWGMVLLAQELNREAFWLSFFQAAAYWLIVLLAFPADLVGMAGAKTAILVFSSLYSGWRLCGFLRERVWDFFVKIAERTFVGIVLIALSSFFVWHLTHEGVFRPELVPVAVACTGTILLASVGQLFASAAIREQVNQIIFALRFSSKD